jgi:mono/diheme cytochrome c family protein
MAELRHACWCWCTLFPLAGALAVALAVLPTGAKAQEQAHPGKAVYDRWCAGCHGIDGKGDGEAAGYMLPRPRDFTLGQYQIRTTASGELPTDADLMRIIDYGMPGTAMPGWRRQLSQRDRTNLVAYIKTFSRFFQNANPQAVDFGRSPRASDDVIARGREVYQQVECWKCHGQAGRGDGQSAPTQEDDTGFPIRPSDLTEPWHFNGGGTVEEIYRRLATGLTGTPMPSFTDAVEAGLISTDDLWSVAHYVRSLAPNDPVVREVVRAERVEGELPATPDDPAWTEVERFYIPLVGQIIVRPRWFTPAVDGVWVQALHNGQDLALRLVWTDPSRSPAREWAQWRARVQQVMEPKEGATAPGAAAAGAAAGAQPSEGVDATVQTGPLPDVVAVQFPRRMPTGMERPYFLMGTAREPVYLWRWQSQPEDAIEMLGRGIGRFDPLPGGGNALAGQSVFEEGQWRVVLRRSLTAVDTANALSFAAQQPIPMALFAWDGDNGEDGARGAISTWYFIYLDEPTSGAVYAAPVVAMLLTAGLGVFAVGRAQRRERERNGNRGT